MMNIAPKFVELTADVLEMKKNKKHRLRSGTEPKLRSKSINDAKPRRKGGKTKRAEEKKNMNTRNAEKARNAKNAAGRVL